MISKQNTLFAQVDALRQKSAEREAAKAQARRQQAEENRRRMPQVTAWVDDLRAAFGEVKVIHAQEGDVSLGQPSLGGISLAETSIIGRFHR